MKKVLVVAAVAEAATGMALLIVPSLVGQLLLGENLTGLAIPVARGFDRHPSMASGCFARNSDSLPCASLAAWRAAKAPVMSAYGT